MVSRDKIIEVIPTYIGVPYKLYGRSTTGVDCLGLIIGVLKDSGIQIPNFTKYNLRKRNLLISILDKNLKLFFDEISFSKIKDGDIILTYDPHLGFYYNNTFIHASFYEKKVVQVGADFFFSNKVKKCYNIESFNLEEFYKWLM